MKNLKKILIALAVVAVIVSSLALIVGAEGEYSGTLKKLYDTYASVEGAATAQEQAKVLADTYKYLEGNPVDPESTYTVTVGEGDEATTTTYTYDQVLALMGAKSVEIGEALYTELTAAGTSEGRFAAAQVLLAHIKDCPAEETDGFTALVEKAQAKNVEVVAEQYDVAIAIDDPSVAKTYAVVIYNHINNYPIDETANADLLANVKALICTVAEQLYVQWSAITADHVDDTADGLCDVCGADPTQGTCTDGEEHVDTAGKADGKCDVCDKAVTDSAADHYHKRYNGIYSAKYYIAQVGYLVNNVVVSSNTDAEKNAANAIVNACKQMDAEMTEKQVELDSKASFDTYDLGGPYSAFDCENTMFKTFNGNASFYSTAATDIYGNKYQSLHYGSPAVHFYVEPDIGTKQDAYKLGMIIEWDQLFGDDFTSSEYVARQASVDMVNLFTLTNNNGVITVKNSINTAKQVSVPSASNTTAVVPNVWAHFTLTYNNDTRVGKLYINYEYVCDIAYHQTAIFGGLRMGKSVVNQTHGYDNFTVINGTEYRIHDKFEKMTDAEKFIYFVEEVVNENNASLTRNDAYKRARVLYGDVKAACEKDNVLMNKCKDALEKYEGIVYDTDIKKPAMEQNLSILTDKVNALLEIGKALTSETTADAQLAIDEINAFISVNGELINKGDTSEGGYQDLMADINTVKTNLVKIENVIAFVDALTKFERASTYTSMTKYAEIANSVYVIAGYDVEENANYIKNDPVVQTFEKKINPELEPEDENYISLFEYYETVAAKIAVRSLYENAKRVISCMNFITSMEGYEANAAFWTKNADYISPYVNIARDIVVNGNYDTTVAGIEEAVATFYELDVCFYEILQQEHIKVITVELEKYLATEIYIDKVGVCAVVEQYLAENDIAVYNTNMSAEVAAAVADEIEQLKELIIVYGVYNDELEAQKEDYEAVLAQNTQYFINTINHMTTVLTYSELKPLFEKATGYYYSTDVNSEAAAAAVEKYIAYREQLAALETNGAIFVGFVNGLYEAQALTGVEREDAIYAILVECAGYVDLVDEGVRGVANAMERYETALASYNAELEIVNSDISESAKVICAVRTDYISSIVLAIVRKMFAN